MIAASGHVRKGKAWNVGISKKEEERK